MDISIYFTNTNFNDKWNIVRWFADFRVECVSTKACVAWGEENEVYNRVSITWVIYKPSRARV